MDTIPTKEFLEAYRRVTGNDDTSPGAVFRALLDNATMHEIRRVHVEICEARKAPQQLSKKRSETANRKTTMAPLVQPTFEIIRRSRNVRAL